MTAPHWTSSNLDLLSKPSAAMNAPLVVVPWSKFGTRRLYAHTTDGQLVGWVDLKTGHRSLAMPELAPAFGIAVSKAEHAPTETADSRMPRRALEQEIELALIAGHAAHQAQESTPSDPAQNQSAEQPEVAPDNQADEHPALMRRAYRGRHAYSSWDLGARGKRLVADELDQPVSPDPRWAYQNSTSVHDHNTNIAQLFVGAVV